MDYQTLIKLCKKYNIEYRNHYGKSKSYIKLKRKVDEYQHIQNKKRKINNDYCQYFNIYNDELETPIRFYIGDL